MIKKWILNLNGLSSYKELYLNRLIVLFSFIFPFSESTSKSIIVIIVLLFLSSSRWKILYAGVKQMPVLIILALTFFIYISASYTELYGDNIRYANRFVVYLLLPMWIISVSLTGKYIKYVINSFLFSMLINEIIAYGILFGWWLELSQGYPVYFMPHVFYSVLLSLTIMLMLYNIKINYKLILTTLFLRIISFLAAYNIYAPFKMMMNDTVKSFVDKDYNTIFGTRIVAYVLISEMIEHNTFAENLKGWKC